MPVAIANLVVCSGLDIWNVPSKKARVEDIDDIGSSRFAACSEPESGPTSASNAAEQGSGASTGVAGKRFLWTTEMVRFDTCIPVPIVNCIYTSLYA